ncbi:MAG: transposase [Planctomycetes bacterium]|nr:transposase [Planctomycetota bacterium]
MDRIPVFVGLDYHKDSVRVCVEGVDGQVLGNRGCANDVQRVLNYAEGFGCVQGAAIESCEGAADFAEELIAKGGWKVHLAHPGYVRRLRQNPDKTDHSDARLLADLQRVGYVPRVWLAPQSVRELRRLVRYRRQLVNERRAIKLRIRSLLREHRRQCEAPRWGKAWFSWMRNVVLPDSSRWILDRHLGRLEQLNADIVEVEKNLESKTHDDFVVQKLLTLTGVGPVTAWVLRAEVGRVLGDLGPVSGRGPVVGPVPAHGVVSAGRRVVAVAAAPEGREDHIGEQEVRAAKAAAVVAVGSMTA